MTKNTFFWWERSEENGSTGLNSISTLYNRGEQKSVSESQNKQRDEPGHESTTAATSASRKSDVKSGKTGKSLPPEATEDSHPIIANDS